MVLSLNRWVGKVAVVTGASSGIGAAIATHFVKNGLLVAGLARRVERVEQLASNLKHEKGKLFAFKCDIRNEEEVVTAFKLVNETIGTVQILVNNAGLLLPTELIDGDSEKWKTCIDTNILGLCVATKEAIKYITANSVKGHIIHINSILGHRVIDMPGFNVYAATKHAVTALTTTLRMEVTRNELPIRVTSVSPGYVITEFGEVGLEGKLDAPGLNADDIAEAVLYVLSTPEHVNVTELELQICGSKI